MDPATITAIAMITAAALKGGSSMMQGAAGNKNAKRDAKEMKRRTMADLYGKALGRELDLYKFTSEMGGANTANRASALQNTANGFRQALVGG